MMSKVAVIVTNDVEDIEYTSPVEALKNAGHEVVTIENEAGNQIVGKHGTKLTADKGIGDVKPDEFDGLLIPGGFSPDQLRADDRFVNFVKAFLMDDKPTFAICHGPQLFIQTGLTAGRTMTAYLTVRPDLYYAGARVKDQPVVVDRNLVTSRTPDDLDDFNGAMLAILKK
ncbi:type 1 glutamine amidotransferase [Lentilactobacillus buchneri]|nr:type 1 glutamine amidotransferase [Lentilactobacillus buchneri]WCJ51154.1 type 1 glutamine amidotransferase [Lentilactobacillus sp. Egmn17]